MCVVHCESRLDARFGVGQGVGECMGSSESGIRVLNTRHVYNVPRATLYEQDQYIYIYS
jgi:hypothetical protein